MSGSSRTLTSSILPIQTKVSTRHLKFISSSRLVRRWCGLTFHARSSHAAFICRQSRRPGTLARPPTSYPPGLFGRFEVTSSQIKIPGESSLSCCFLSVGCAICIFRGLSVRFVTGYLLPPRMTDLLLAVLAGECERRGRTRRCGTVCKWNVRASSRWCVWARVCFVKKKNKTNCNVIYYKEEAIITGGSHTKVPSALSWGPLQDRLLLMCLLPIDHPGSSTRFILVIAASMNVGLWRKLHHEV